MKRYLDVKNEIERIDYETREDDFYAKVKQANDLNDLNDLNEVLPTYNELEKKYYRKN